MTQRTVRPAPREPGADGPSRPGLGTALSSLRGNRAFQLLWVSNLFFFGGVWTQTLVLGWLAYELTHSEFLVAVYTAARLAPLLLGPFAGVLADAIDRLRLLLLACGWASLAVAIVAMLASTGRLSYGVLVAGGLAIGLAQSPSQPARAALVLELVGRSNLSNANALNSIAMNMTQVIGPALGGGMIALLGAPAALWISTLWYLASFALLLPLRRLRAPQPSPHRGVSVLRMVTSGITSIAANRLALAVLLVTLAANTLLWPIFQSFMPVFAGAELGLDAAGLGALLTCAGAGGLLGSLLIAGLGDFRAKGAVFVLGTLAWAMSWVAFALAGTVTAAFLLMGLIGLFSAAFGVLQTTLLLMTTEPEVHGRALGVQELAIGIMPLAALVLGQVAEHVGVGWTTVGAGLVMVAVLIALMVRVPALLRFDGITADGPA
ncbi:MFS transporter [Brachybacterium sp. YJGR34]|uniref:MFS transporter n=1 Tax=Brachybacterium sp. YJGR34 TaxID=2059911 RepID=UPI000E0AB70A|nr:MFS transporter [Brachybacterium sp. YJGR34]